MDSSKEIESIIGTLGNMSVKNGSIPNVGKKKIGSIASLGAGDLDPDFLRGLEKEKLIAMFLDSKELFLIRKERTQF